MDCVMLNANNSQVKSVSGIPRPKFTLDALPNGNIPHRPGDGLDRTSKIPKNSTGAKSAPSGIPKPQANIQLGHSKMPSQSQQSGARKASALWRSKAMLGKSGSASTVPKSPTSPGTPPVTSQTSSVSKFNFQNVAKLNQQREQEKEHIRALERQVKALKQTCEEQRKQNQSLQARVDELVSEQGATGDRLLSASQQADHLQLELHSATEALQKSHKDHSQLEDRCRQLELRASGVDQAQIALQTTQKALDNCQFRLNEQERRVGQLTEERDKTQKTLQVCQSRVKYLECQVNDLNYQLMQEIIKNQNIEKKIEGVPYLEDKIVELEKTVKKRDQELEQKSALLISSRKTLREYKEKLREQENRFREVEELQAELDLSRNEVSTLKRLQAGKDVLVLQKSQALDFAKDVLETLQYSAEAEKLERVQELIERSCHVLSSKTPSTASSRTQSTARSSPSPDSDRVWTEGSGSVSTRNGRPWTVTAGFRGSIAAPGYRGPARHDNRFLECLLTDGDHRESHLSQSYPRRGQSSPVRPSTSHCAPSREAWSRSSSKRLVYRNETQNKMRYRPSSDITCKSEEIECLNLRHPGTFDTSSTNSSANQHVKMADIITRILDEKELHELHISGSPDVFYSAVLQLGDRVFVKFPQSHRSQKPMKNSVLQRFGSKKASKEKNYCGIIKYKGSLGTTSSEMRVYVGINLDDPVGDTDGRVGDERYMYTTTEHGKFLRISNVVSVFDVESSRYVELAALKQALMQRTNEK